MARRDRFLDPDVSMPYNERADMAIFVFVLQIVTALGLVVLMFVVRVVKQRKAQENA